MKFVKSAIIACSIAALSTGAFAGEFQVSPIMLELGKTAKSGVVTVSNVGSGKVNLQVRAMQWIQDAKGKDIYSDTTDIVYFPRIISLEKGDSQLIRVGMKGSPPPTEKTYRLYIEEIPGPQKADADKVRVAIAIRFGVPIFIKPEHESLKGKIDTINVVKGNATAVVRNTGNIHFRITTVTVEGETAGGKKIFSKEIPGWYLLAGAAREYTATLPQDICRKVAQLRFVVKAEGFTITGSHPVYQEMCLP